MTAASFAPAVDVYEDEHQVVLSLEVPGIKQEDLDIQVEKNTLTVRGERKFEKNQKEQNFHRIERRYGTFYRSFALPATVDTENVHATYDTGVLKLELTKKAEAKPKQIKVNISNGGSVSSGAAAKPIEANAQKKKTGNWYTPDPSLCRALTILRRPYVSITTRRRPSFREKRKAASSSSLEIVPVWQTPPAAKVPPEAVLAHHLLIGCEANGNSLGQIYG